MSARSFVPLPMPDLAALLHHRRLHALCLLLALAYALSIGLAYRDGQARAARGERPLFTDFTTTYGAALALASGPAEWAYHPEVIAEANTAAGQAAYGGTLSGAQAENIRGRWMYPPTFIPLVRPLADLPYLQALSVWLLLSGALYLVAARAILGGGGMLLALALPTTFYNAMFGQTGFLIAGLVGLGLSQLARRPVLAGVLIGLASVKPHLGLLIPLALLAGGEWRAFAAAATTVLAMLAGSLLAYGPEPWFAFLGMLQANSGGFEADAFAWPILTSALSAAYHLDVGMDGAWRVQAGSAALAAVLVGRVWWRVPAGGSRDAAAAVLLAALPWATPMIYLYDLTLVAVALLFLWRDGQRRGASRVEAGVWLVAVLALALVKLLGALVGVAAELLVLGLALYRAGKTSPG